MKSCFCFLFLLLFSIQGAVAQPRIRLVDSTKKTWMPDGKGTVGLRFRNAGTQPLVVTNALIRAQSPQIFKLLTTFTAPKIVAPGDTSFVIVEVNATIAYEYSASIDLLSNDPAKPLTTFSLRVNDSIPPQRVRSLNAVPLKGGYIHVNWLAPVTPRDGDSVAQYRVFVIAETGSEEIYTGLDRSVTAKSKFEGDVIVSVLTYDDMGNKSATFDTTWIDGSRPRVQLTHVDQEFPGVTEHIARGKQRLSFAIRDWHLAKVDVHWRDPGTSGIQPIASFSTFKQEEEEHPIYFDWNTAPLRGEKEVVIVSRDEVENIDTTIYRFFITQINGWPKRMFNHQLASSATILKDEGGRFLLTGSDIANGAFRPNGHHFFYQWPLDITRSFTDHVITASTDLDRNNQPEVIALSQDNRIIMMNMHGKIMESVGEVTLNDRHVSVLETPDSSILLTGASPIAVKGNDGSYRVFGATQSLRPDGSNAELERALTDDGVREKDRFAVADLDRDGNEEIVRVHDNGTWEEFSIRTPDGQQVEGPVAIWKPTASYRGFFPSIGDIDGDNDLEIVIPAPNDSIYAYHHTGASVTGYPVFVQSSASGRNQAMIVDLNADGSGDIVLPVTDSIVAFDGKRARMIANMIWPIRRKGPGTELITIADLNSDKYLELIDPPAPGDTSWVYAFDLNVQDAPGTVEWGTFQHDMLRSGNYNTPSKALHSDVKSPKETVQGVVLIGKTLQLHRSGKLELSDMLGRILLSRAIESEENIDLSALPHGTYLVRMDELVVTKIVL